MKKVCLLMFAFALMVTGCTKAKTNKLQGLWSSEPREVDYPMNCNHRDDVYNFINSNTVVRYLNVYDNINCYNLTMYHYSAGDAMSISGHSGWYRDSDELYLTYVFEDNKVIVSNGVIFTYMNGKLYKESSSSILSPW